jgi:hypothetical protein
VSATAARRIIPAQPVWRTPIQPESCDRSSLSDAERRALAVLVNGHCSLEQPSGKKGRGHARPLDPTFP